MPPCAPPPKPPCPPPMPPPRASAGDARASAVPSTAAVRQLRTLLFIPISSVVELPRRISSPQEDDQDIERIRYFQMNNATVSDTKVSLDASQRRRVIRDRPPPWSLMSGTHDTVTKHLLLR